MKKFFKGLILLPMWPLIWHIEYKERNGLDSGCMPCGAKSVRDSDCFKRAEKMRAWYNR